MNPCRIWQGFVFLGYIWFFNNPKRFINIPKYVENEFVKNGGESNCNSNRDVTCLFV